MDQITIHARDGECRSYLFKPKGGGAWPAAILYMDGMGIRPALLGIGERLSQAGLLVLVPDLYYRHGIYEPLVAAEIFASGNIRKGIGRLLEATDERRAGEDTKAFLTYLAARNDVAGPKVGVTGYCRGGGMALRAAGLYPDRIAAAASFHGGNLATDSLESPHLLASRIKARVYVAGADRDPSYPPEMAERLVRALSEAGVEHRCEIYDGVRHGWTMRDFPVYDPVADERHLHELTRLFRETLC